VQRMWGDVVARADTSMSEASEAIRCRQQGPVVLLPPHFTA
jgi:hypothetical protein